jgi:hypothetical protein
MSSERGLHAECMDLCFVRTTSAGIYRKSTRPFFCGLCLGNHREKSEGFDALPTVRGGLEPDRPWAIVKKLPTTLPCPSSAEAGIACAGFTLAYRLLAYCTASCTLHGKRQSSRVGQVVQVVVAVGRITPKKTSEVDRKYKIVVVSSNQKCI